MSKGIAIGPLLFVICFGLSLFYPESAGLCLMGGITAMVASWWFHPDVPVGIASMVPFIFIPLCGIAPASDVAAAYMDPIIFLFLGGFLLSLAIEKTGLHKRLAFIILAKTAHSERTVLAGIMAAAFLVSMWISNTATMLMFLAASTSIIKQWLQNHPSSKIAPAIMLGVAYSANLGGMATLVGTPTNMIFAGYYTNIVKPEESYSFLTWMMQAFPLAFLLVVFCFFLLQRMFGLEAKSEGKDKTWFREQVVKLGPARSKEKFTMLVFGLVALLWISRSPITMGSFTLPGWSAVFEKPGYITDGTIAILGSACLFLIIPYGEKKPVLIWEDAQKIPLEILLLFGGGFALAKGFESSGLSHFMAKQLAAMHELPPIISLLFILCLITCISEFASNVASIQLMLPVLLPLSQSLHIDPLFLMVPATLSASLGFMLPIATAPNTIAFSSGYVSTQQMARAGLWMNIAGIIGILIAAFLFY